MSFFKWRKNKEAEELDPLLSSSASRISNDGNSSFDKGCMFISPSPILKDKDSVNRDVPSSPGPGLDSGKGFHASRSADKKEVQLHPPRVHCIPRS
jgi:hypothetical protein